MVSTDVLTLDEKRALLKELKTVRWTGAYRIRFADRDVTYKSETELKSAIKALEDDINRSTAPKKASVVLTTFGSGF